MKTRCLIIFTFVILFAGLVSASFEIGNQSHLIDNQYGPSDNIIGWINISLNQESANSFFQDSLGNSISLIDLMDKNPNFKYNCSILNCTSDYSATNAETSKSFNLNDEQSKIVGIKFSKDITSIDSIDFRINSNAPSSCDNQLKIDFLNNGVITTGNNKILNDDCSKKYGDCFDKDNPTSEFNINYILNGKHCQRIELSASPGFKLGAWVRDSENLVMTLYHLNRSHVTYFSEGEWKDASCELTSGTGAGEISCDINYFVTEPKDYYVCIYSDDETNQLTSKIRGYETSDGCGFYGNQPENAAFQIFAEGKRFNTFHLLEVSNNLSSGSNIGKLAEDYIKGKYGDLNCLNKECIVPLKLIGGDINGATQQVTISNLEIKYGTSLGDTVENNLYDLSETPSTINADFQKLSLNEAELSVAEEYGERVFELRLNTNLVFSENITVERIPIIKILKPITTASAFPTKFEVKVQSFDDTNDSEGNTTENQSSSEGIIKYEWDFGDNNVKTTTSSEIIHTYESTGNYELKITVTDSNERSAYRIFYINVSTPEQEINKSLKHMQENLMSINEQIKSLPSFYKLDSILNIKGFEDELTKIQREYNQADSEEEYNAIITKLLSMDVPKSISTGTSAESILFYPEKSKVNLGILQKIAGGDYETSDESAYIDAIFAWNQANMETRVDFEEILVKYDYSEESILKVFKVKIDKKGGSSDKSYLILEKLDGIEFKENYREREESGYFFITLEESEKTIEFTTTEEINFINLPLFISPAISRLSIIEGDIDYDEDDGGFSKWIFFILVIFFLIILGLVGYIILQEWYRKKYENYLFKKRNDLYNLITYIANAKKKGMKPSEIKSKLKKSSWSSEQIDYVMKKYSGKRTGMFQLPVDKILNMFRKEGPSPHQERGKGFALRRYEQRGDFLKDRKK